MPRSDTQDPEEAGFRPEPEAPLPSPRKSYFAVPLRSVPHTAHREMDLCSGFRCCECSPQSCVSPFPAPRRAQPDALRARKALPGGYTPALQAIPEEYRQNERVAEALSAPSPSHCSLAEPVRSFSRGDSS